MPSWVYRATGLFAGMAALVSSGGIVANLSAGRLGWAAREEATDA